jgi:hypothetical protein
VASRPRRAGGKWRGEKWKESGNRRKQEITTYDGWDVYVLISAEAERSASGSVYSSHSTFLGELHPSYHCESSRRVVVPSCGDLVTRVSQPISAISHCQSLGLVVRRLTYSARYCHSGVGMVIACSCVRMSARGLAPTSLLSIKVHTHTQ